MLCIRHCYFRLFHANNKQGNRIFSNWLNSHIIFGSQFRQILNRNVHCNILFKSRQFCQHNKFCTGNNDGFHSIPIVNTNSEGTHENHLLLETQLLELDNKKQLQIKLEKGKTGHKFFRITLIKLFNFADFRKILFPHDAYSFVRALDELIMELVADNFEQKLHIQDSQSTISKLKTVQLNGKNHNYQLELVLRRNTIIDKMNAQMQQICLRICAENKIIDFECRMTFPLEALPWMRKQMAEMLTKHDGTEAIALEAPAQIPQKFFQMDVFHHPNDGNNYFVPQQLELEQNGIRQQFTNNKKPSSTFQQYSKMPTKMQQNSNQSGFKKQNKMKKKPPKRPKMADLEEEEIAPHFDFDADDDEMKKYRIGG